MSQNFRSSGSRLYLPANSTQADFTTVTPVLANGVRSDMSVIGGHLYINYANTINWKVIVPNLYRGMRVEFVGAGADDSTFNYRMWAVTPRLAATANMNAYTYGEIVSLGLVNYGIGTGILSTQVGTGNPVAADNRYADTLTFTLADGTTTPTGVGDVYGSAYNLGTPTVYSPTNNSGAVLAIPDLSNLWGIVIEFDLGTATSMNALVEFTV